MTVIIIVAVATGVLVAACFLAHDAWHNRLDREFYAGYMHGLSQPANVRAITSQPADRPLDGKEVVLDGNN